MNIEKQNTVNCSQFEEFLTDYLDKALDATLQRSVAEHALAAPAHRVDDGAYVRRLGAHGPQHVARLVYDPA